MLMNGRLVNFATSCFFQRIIVLTHLVGMGPLASTTLMIIVASVLLDGQGQLAFKVSYVPK